MYRRGRLKTMCAICGIMNLENKKAADSRQIAAMNEEMFLRGPDGGGIWMSPDGSCGFGHRRLSILDLSDTAGQPMLNGDGKIALTYNGEIYNYREIRNRLEKTGKYTWKTDHSDTEVLLHAYEEWGMACLDEFRGMFAFAIWDATRGCCILARDRLGIKPLYYMKDDGRLVFASEIKALLKVRVQPRRINEKAMYDYLSFLSSPGEETLTEGIYKLPPASYLVFTKDGLVKKTRYWDVLDHIRPDVRKADADTLSQMVLAELRTSVNYRKRADVPVGVFLSGGVDSSANMALFSEGETGRAMAFCIGYDRNYSTYQNENRFARLMARRCHAQYYEQLLKEDDLFEFLPVMAKLMDEPAADPTCFPAYYVSRLAREHGVTVAQTGEGSDELFWGYRRWKAYLRLSQLDRIPFPKVLKYTGLGLLCTAGKGGRDYTELLRRSICGVPVFWSGAEGFHEYDKNRLLSDAWRKHFRGYTSFEAVRPVYERFMDKAWEKSYVSWMGYADLNHRLPELLLMRVDKMSMANSLECRVPFLDHKFVELAMSISQKQKTQGGVNKAVLKRAVKGLVPDELVYRKKQGFTAPVYDWFLGRLGKKMHKDVLAFADETGYFNKRYINELFSSQVNAKKIWYLFNLALWYQTHIQGNTSQ